jgi:hypothetical protein
MSRARVHTSLDDVTIAGQILAFDAEDGASANFGGSRSGPGVRFGARF